MAQLSNSKPLPEGRASAPLSPEGNALLRDSLSNLASFFNTEQQAAQLYILEAIESFIDRCRKCRNLPRTASFTPESTPPITIPDPIVTTTIHTIPSAAQPNHRPSTLHADEGSVTETPPPPPPAAAPTSGSKRSKGQDNNAPRRKRVKRESKELVELELALDEQVAVTDLVSRRDDFYNRLLQLEVQHTRDFSTETVSFTAEEAITITNFFFSDVMGTQAYNRVAEIINFYTRKDDIGIDTQAAARASVLAKDANVPLAIREFYSTFSDIKRGQTYHIKDISYAGFLKHNARINMWSSWNSLRQLASQKDPDIIRFLNHQGYRISKGKDYRTMVNEYLGNALQVNVSSETQSAFGLAHLAEHFGPAITLLLPPNAHVRIKQWGNQRMTEVYKILKSIVPEFAAVCSAIEPIVYTPIILGHKVDLQLLDAPRSLSQIFDSRVVDLITGSDTAADQSQSGGSEGGDAASATGA